MSGRESSRSSEIGNNNIEKEKGRTKKHKQNKSQTNEDNNKTKTKTKNEDTGVKKTSAGGTHTCDSTKRVEMLIRKNAGYVVYT